VLIAISRAPTLAGPGFNIALNLRSSQHAAGIAICSPKPVLGAKNRGLNQMK